MPGNELSYPALPNDLADEFRDFLLRFFEQTGAGVDFAGDHHDHGRPGIQQRPLPEDLSQVVVKDTVGDPVSQFVGMTFGD